MQHDHCSYCGTRYAEGQPWPRLCPGCGETTWRNPLPVAVLLLPVHYPGGQRGLVVVRRDIEPFRGELSLPGGFIEAGESWQQAAARELTEETGLPAAAAEVSLFDVQSSYNGHSLLVFGIVPQRDAHTMPASQPTAEATEWLVITEPIRLAFPTHTMVMANFFASAGATTPPSITVSGR